MRMTAPPDSPGRLDDTALIEQSRHRPESFATPYDRHFGDIYRYVAARIGPQAADDLASETFLVAFRKRDGFDPERGAVRRWLYGIATNLLADHRRSETRRLEALARVPVASPAESEHADRVAARVTAAGERTAERLRGRWKGTAGDLIWDSITWQEARAIPGDPGRLRTYLERYVRRQVAHPDSGMDVEEMPRLLRAVCIRMITGLPVSPEARASAYRILASLPGIRAGGGDHGSAGPARAGARLSGGGRAGPVHRDPFRGRSRHRPAARRNADERGQGRRRAAGGAPLVHLVPGDRLDRRTTGTARPPGLRRSPIRARGPGGGRPPRAALSSITRLTRLPGRTGGGGRRGRSGRRGRPPRAARRRTRLRCSRAATCPRCRTP